MKTSILLLWISLVVSFNLRVSSQETVKDQIQKAQKLIQQNQKAEASSILVKIMGSHPSNKEAVQWWLIANMKRTPTGEMDAIKQLDSLATLFPANTGLIFYKSFILAEYGKNEEALAGFEKLIALQPDSADNYIGKGQLLYDMKKYQDAFEAFAIASVLNPARTDVWGMKANALAKLGKFDEALAAINKGMDQAPGKPVDFYNRACIYSLKGDKTNALADLSKAIEKNPRIKQNAVKDEDFKNLWEDEDFKKLTSVTEVNAARNVGGYSDSGCMITVKNYTRKEYQPKISGTWQAVEAWVHESNLLGQRIFMFTFMPNDSIKIEEKARNYFNRGTWSINQNDNTIQWSMPADDDSFKGIYDFVNGNLVLSGRGFVGASESICLKLKKVK